MNRAKDGEGGRERAVLQESGEENVRKPTSD